MDNFTLMKRALKLAAKARGMTSPNPMVGAVLAKGEKIIAEDYHRMPGTPHAEALVIQKAKEKARGATIVVNLEPCCHTDKRTPPCTKAIINAGIKKVAIAMKDPNPKVSGKGIDELERAGIKVIAGILEEEAKKLNEAYFKYITTKKPFVTLKVAMTLDGKIATPEGESKWITGEKARTLVHRLRNSVDAVIIAIGTVKADDPQMTARVKSGKDRRAEETKRIVIDPNLEIPAEAKILHTPPETIVVTKKFNHHSPPSFLNRSVGELEKKIDFLTGKGIKIIEYENEKLDLKWLVDKLGMMEITSLMIEGGSSLNAHALEDGIVDKVMFFIAPKIIAGKDSFPAVGGKTFRKLAEAYKLIDIKLSKVGDDILIEGYVNKQDV